METSRKPTFAPLCTALLMLSACDCRKIEGLPVGCSNVKMSQAASELLFIHTSPWFSFSASELILQNRETQNMTTWVLESHAHWTPHAAGFTDKTRRRASDLLNTTPRDPSNLLHFFWASDQTNPLWLTTQTCDINRCNSAMCWRNKEVLYLWRNHVLERCSKVITDNQQITKHFNGSNMVLWFG